MGARLCGSKSQMANATAEAPQNGAGAAVPAEPLAREDSYDLKSQTVSLKQVYATQVTRQELYEKLRACALHSRGSQQLTDTLIKCVNMLAEGVGGMIVSIIHEDVLNQGSLKFDYLDRGLHTQVFRDVCKSLNEPEFATMLELLTAHNETDRWESQELDALVSRIPSAQKYWEKLHGQPKDGAITFSHLGSVKGAAMHLKHPSSRLQMTKSNGSAAGTRHASALGFAEHLCSECTSDFFPGVVFARSDGGGAHAFIPQKGGDPLIVHFDTLRIPTQEDMLSYFKDIIMKKGRLLRKESPVLARLGTVGEQVVSVVEGKVTSTKTITDETTMVLRANTPDQEYYALPRHIFELNYQADGIDIAKSEKLDQMKPFAKSSTQALIKKGFQLYYPKPDQRRWAYEVTEEDMKRVPTDCFQAKWDPSVLQPLRRGDILGMPAPEDQATEIYWMPHHAMSAYIECTSQVT